MFTKEDVYVFYEWSPLKKSLDVCDEFPNGCSSHQNQVLGALVILPQKMCKIQMGKGEVDFWVVVSKL